MSLFGVFLAINLVCLAIDLWLYRAHQDDLTWQIQGYNDSVRALIILAEFNIALSFLCLIIERLM